MGHFGSKSRILFFESFYAEEMDRCSRVYPTLVTAMSKMTREEFDLLQGVIGAPDDVAPRLVYADWLEEHGELLRADFIRRHCQSGTFTNGSESLSDVKAVRYGLRFIPKPIRKYFVHERNYNGGLLTRLEMTIPKSPERFLAEFKFVRRYAAIRILAVYPQVEKHDWNEITFEENVPIPTEYIRRLCESTHLQHLNQLILHSPFEEIEESAGIIIDCEHLINIRSIDFQLGYKFLSEELTEQKRIQRVSAAIRKRARKQFGIRLVWRM